MPQYGTQHRDEPGTPGSIVRVGSRGSALALRQVAIVVGAIAALDPTIVCQIQVIRTPGDDTAERDLAAFDGQGAFIRGLDVALRSEEVDLVVHSAKDMPSADMDGLMIGAFLPREDPRDALVSTEHIPLRSLAPGARVGTGSPRRAAMLHSERPDLRVEPIRGNVDTRLRRVARRELDGVIVAAAGLARLERLSEASELLDPGIFVPAVGQGILAVQVRREENAIAALIRALDDEVTRACAAAERAVSITLGAGCQTPLGAYARLENGRLVVDAYFVHGPGREPVRARAEGALPDAVELGARAARALQRQTAA